MVTCHQVTAHRWGPRSPNNSPMPLPFHLRFCEILTWDSCWVTAKGSSFEKLFLHYHYFPYRSLTENRKASRHYSKSVCNVIPLFSVTPGNVILHHPRIFPRILISSLSWLLKVFPMSLLQRRKTFKVLQESWWQVNQVTSFIIMGGLDGLDGLGLYPLSTSRKTILDLQLILTSLGNFQKVTWQPVCFIVFWEAIFAPNSGAGKWFFGGIEPMTNWKHMENINFSAEQHLDTWFSEITSQRCFFCSWSLALGLSNS